MQSATSDPIEDSTLVGIKWNFDEMIERNYSDNVAEMVAMHIHVHVGCNHVNLIIRVAPLWTKISSVPSLPWVEINSRKIESACTKVTLQNGSMA